LSNTELSVERRANLFMLNDTFLLFECRFRGIELLFGNNFSRSKIARPKKIGPSQFQIGFLLRCNKLDKNVTFLCFTSAFKIHLPHCAGEIC